MHNPSCYFNSIKGLLQSLKKNKKRRGTALFRIKKEKKKENQVILERHDIPRALETPFLFSSENTETKQI